MRTLTKGTIEVSFEENDWNQGYATENQTYHQPVVHVIYDTNDGNY
jgi:hypothetical protein